jgi:hypothetical protein
MVPSTGSADKVAWKGKKRRNAAAGSNLRKYFMPDII